MTHAQALEKHAAERYLLDEMPELERYAFEAHFFDCAECAEDVRAGALMREGVAAGLLPSAPAVPVSPLAPPAHVAALPSSSGWRTGLPWAVAAMLALTVGYQSLWVVPGLRDQAIPAQAVVPVTLRAATRGAETTVIRPAAGVISFALDVNAAPAGARLAYDLRTAAGAPVVSGTAAAPPPGTPLLLLVPVSAVAADGSYVLTVRVADATQPAPVDYRFTLTK
jgi:hypothetical protein